MRALMSEYGRTILYAALAVIAITIFGYVMFGGGGMAEGVTESMSGVVSSADETKAETNISYKTMSRPKMELSQNIHIDQGAVFDVITTPALSIEDGTTKEDITNNVQIFGTLCGRTYNGSWSSNRTVSCDTAGLYELRYSIRDSKGFYVTKTIQVIVDPVID